METRYVGLPTYAKINRIWANTPRTHLSPFNGPPALGKKKEKEKKEQIEQKKKDARNEKKK